MSGVRMSRPPRRDRAIEAALSARFRSGEIYSYSYENGVWTTWTDEHDWLHTERNGHRRCLCISADASTAGPQDWDREELLGSLGLGEPRRSTRLTKAQLVSGLRAIVDQLPAEAVALLEAS